MAIVQLDSIENAVLSAVINPILKRVIRSFDIYCPKDGNLLINSLKVYLGENLNLCERCERLTERIAKPFYEIGSRLLRLTKNSCTNNSFKTNMARLGSADSP